MVEESAEEPLLEQNPPSEMAPLAGTAQAAGLAVWVPVGVVQTRAAARRADEVVVSVS